MKNAWIPIILLLLLVLFVFGFYSAANAQDELQGDPFVGGLLYAAWDVILRIELPQENHPLWYVEEPIDLNSWRCVTCHGWDYSGREIPPASETDEGVQYPGVFSMVAEPEENVIAWLDGSNNPNHDFSAFLSNHDMQDVSAFLIAGLINSDLFVEKKTGKVRGTALSGEVLFKDKCRECHGSDGARINFGSAKRPFFMGNLANINPWRVGHIIRFGHIHTIVYPGTNFGWSFNDEIDLLTYLQHLPLAEQMKEEEVVEEVIDFSQQGKVQPLIYAAAALVVVILGGVLWGTRWNRE
jgi:mono/diheme cytochrome c family protein